MDITNIQTPTQPKIKAGGGLFGMIGAELTKELSGIGKSPAQKAAAAAAAAKAKAANATSGSRTAAERGIPVKVVKTTPTPTVPKPTPVTPPSSAAKNTKPKASGGSSSSAPAATPAESAPADPYASIYGPLEQILKNNKLALENRYANNAADIKSITGVLSAISPQDTAKINQQFTQSIEAQQARTAKAIAGTRLENAAGVQGAAASASELGSGDMPVPTSSASGTAYQNQIDNAAAGESNWSNFMTAMQNQQLADTKAAETGYGFEIANALQNLSRQKNADLAALENQGLDLASQKAQSQISAEQNAAKLAQEAAIAQAKNQTALGVASIRAGASSNAAGIRAAATRYAADVRAAANGGTNKLATVRDWEKSVRQQGLAGPDLARLKQSVADIEARIVKQRTTTTATGTTKPGKATAADVYKVWMRENGGASPAVKNAVAAAIDKGFYKYF